MSTIEPGGIVQYEGDPARRRVYTLLAILVLAAAAVALYLEPYFVLDRVRAAVLGNDLDAQHQLVDPGLLDEELPGKLELSRPGKGTHIEQGYEGWARFIVSARGAWTGQESWAGVSEVRLVLQRRGLSWRLADIELVRSYSRDEPPGSLQVRPPSPDDSLPAFGSYVYVEELPEALTRVAPVYPDLARQAGVEGMVLVQALVGRDGIVKDARIAKSIPMLDSAALAAVRQWRFKPAMSKGTPVAVWVAIPVKFTLH